MNLLTRWLDAWGLFFYIMKKVTRGPESFGVTFS